MANTTATPVETLKDFKGPQGEARRWLTEIKLFESENDKYWKRCEKIIRRYRNGSIDDDLSSSTDNFSGRRFSLLWANIQTLQPTLFAHPPKASVERRFKDKDPVGNLASQILERVLDYFIDNNEYIQAIKNARDDFLLVGLGVHWQRYVPHFKDEQYRVGLIADQGPQVTNNACTYTMADGSKYDPVEGEEVETDEEGPYVMRTERVLDTEEVVTDYVSYRDFGHSPGARTWAENSAVWRRVFMTRDELVARFGKEKGEAVQLDYSPAKENTITEDDKQFYKKATIYEIANKSDKEFVWVAKAYDGDVLDKKPDPIGAEGFFPCQPPLFANLTTNSLMPVPDYVQYQDQADEMDRLTEKIYTIMDAIRVRGLYAANIPELQKLLQDSSNLDWTPVDQSIMAMTNGDLAKAVWVWPLGDLVAALKELLQAREVVKQDSYEITGISDIIRGASDPNETLGAQKLKAQTGSIRIRDRQQDMARFIRDGLRIKSDIIVNHFQPETLMRIADVMAIPEFQWVKGPDGQWADPQEIEAKLQQQVQQQAQQPLPAAPGASSALPPQGAPGPQISSPTMGETAIKLLQDPEERKFRIDIETDSTVEVDQAQEKQDSVEVVTAISGFIAEWAPVLAQAPFLGPLFGELLMFAMRRFRGADQLESAVEEAVKSLLEMAKNPPATPPDPALIKAQADVKAKEMDMQIKQQSAQADQQTAQVEAQARQQELAAEQGRANTEAQAEAQRAQMEMANTAQKGQIDQILAQMEVQKGQIDLLIARANLKTADSRADAMEESGEAGD